MTDSLFVAEDIVRVFLDGELAFEFRCTPADIDALIIGRMYVERRGAVVERGSALPPEDFAALFKSLFAAIDERYPEGGMHGAAMVRGNAIAFVAEDVGRHNAVDKAIGKVLLAGEEPSRFGMIVSSRVSGEIARKCARSGIAWLASRSIPTSLALVEAGDMPIIARAVRK